MSVFADDSDREVIPRWLEYQIARSIGLFKGPAVTTVTRNSRYDEEVLRDWLNAPNLATAVELVSHSFINKDFSSSEAVNAAKYLQENSSQLFPLQLEIANYFLSINKDHPTFEQETQPQSIKRTVSKLRLSLQQYPLNSLAWSDLSICYAKNGNKKKSIRAAQVALSLAKHNRFILRNVSSCFFHFGEVDRAIYTLRKSELWKVDPWIASAEIALSEKSGLKSKSLNFAKNLVSDDNLPPFSRSELAAELGSIEFKSGSRGRSSRLIKLALVDPNENSLAQTEWLKKQSLSNIDPHGLTVCAPFEADSWHHYFTKQFQDSLLATKRWMYFQPMSIDPVIQASFLSSTCLNNDAETVNIIEGIPKTMRNNALVLNNYAFSLIKTERINEAEKVLNSIKDDELTEVDRLVLTATLGLLAFRRNQITIGESLYQKAIDGFSILNEPRRAILARFFFALEKKRVSSPDFISFGEDVKKRIKTNEIFFLEDRINELG